MGKDQAIGGAILAICVTVAIFYVATLFYPQWLTVLGLEVTQSSVQFWTIAMPVFIAFVAIMGIGAWIGWTMATTPPPKPFEQTANETDEERSEKSEDRETLK